jgi:quercetin 2,3-dioxygenase
MIERRKFADLGGADHGWLKGKHHFSFANYYDPKRMGWGNLRVWNDDEIAAKSGFPPHPHADMEIITYVREGAITHQDSMGNEGRTTAGDVQVMSAGSGVRHAEYNQENETTRIFQIWIEPNERGGKPAWGAKPFPKADRSGRFVTLASGFASDTEALLIRADARVMGATIKAGERVTIDLDPTRHAYLVAATGAVAVGGVRIEARDGAAITDVAKVEIVGIEARKSSWLTPTECKGLTASWRALLVLQGGGHARSGHRRHAQGPGRRIGSRPRSAVCAPTDGWAIHFSGSHGACRLSLW